MMYLVLWCVLATWCSRAFAAENCGGHLTAERGVIQTPDFPRPFRVPIACRWVIDSSLQPRPSSIVVYLTQLFVTTGISFTEYAYYEADSTFQLEPKVLMTVNDENAALVSTVSTSRNFLVIEFAMDRLEGNHLRALDGLLDVYGLNITYNMHVGSGKIPDYSCTAAKCSLLGHCYAAIDFSSFWCSCFPGFSGPNCREGPLCLPDTNICQNNASCRQLGANDAVCECLPGYTGLQCHRRLPPSDCKDEAKCTKQCRYDVSKENYCSCERYGATVAQDMSHFECTIRLVNISNIGDSTRPLEIKLQKQLVKYLKGANLHKLEDAKVLNITSGGEVRFHFVSSKDSGSRVREMLMQMVEKARLGNFTLNPTQFSFNQEPTLLLQDVTLNRKDSKVRVGESFRFTCHAQGSSRIQFRWFKDGAPVNGSIAIRNISVTTGPEDTSERRKSFLLVSNAHPLDEGDYTCQVFDWGVQQCKSVRLSVIQPLQVKVSPMSSTVQKGSNLTMRCFTSNKPGRRKLGYNWTKNKALFPMVPGLIFWEDLYPDGSILKLRNIQKGGVYTCQAADGVWSGEASGRLDVLDRLLVGSRCPAEGPWPPASPGLQAQAQCPRGYTGIATRLCLLIEPGKGRWQVPDFSKCVSHHTTTITNNFIRLTLGYEGTTARATVFEIASWLGGRTKVHPGEAEPLVSLLANVLDYLNTTKDMPELVNTTPNFITAVSSLLLRNASIINQQ
ncbi:uncharacterized protein LOC106671005, partial [Cimex lectularius]|uniref:Uncharacterized protein n=1 Tax=Cimex lectularius TaxID=79782 RepID=A0A8I6SP18_CIMLE